MRGITTWNQTPYSPLQFDAGTPYICRMVPMRRGFTLEWLAVDGVQSYEIYCAKRYETLVLIGSTGNCSFRVEGLEESTDYQVQVRCAFGRSRTRLIRTGEAVGTVVNYLHPEDDCYSFSGCCLCSPCLVRLPSGALLASMDLFEGGGPQNLTLLFRSEDDGKTWHYQTELMPCFWGRMFVHKGELFMLAVSTEYGDLLIGKSTDEGRTFTMPTVLLRGSGKTKKPGVHKNPQPVVPYAGRLWCTLEWGTWAEYRHAAMVMSAPEDADLLDAACWEISEPTAYDPAWPGVAHGHSAGNIEGTLVVFPDGKLRNVMRYDMMRCIPNHGLVLSYLVDAAHPERAITFEKAISFPGNHSKFEIHYDPVSGRYLSIVSRILGAGTAGARNLLSLIVSTDGEHWHTAADLIDRRTEDPALIGFQYVDFLIEGDDLLFLCRTAMNGARSYHDSNFSTFHRVSHFRSLFQSIHSSEE